MARNETELVLFLLGKTGHGKSSTANTILGRHAFQTSDDGHSDTYLTQCGWSRLGSRVVQVVDSPGVCETRLSREKAAKKMVEDLSKGIFLCPSGFDALVIVCSYGTRFTPEEVQAVNALKSVFGENFIRDFGIVVFTHGEQLDMTNESRREPQSFEDWCRNQQGSLRDLINECENRCVLFRNLRRNDSQVETLLQTVERLKQRGVRYTKELFDALKDTQERFCAEENAAALRPEIQRQVSLLQDAINHASILAKSSGMAREEGVRMLDTLLIDARSLKSEIDTHDKGTGVLAPLKMCVESLELNIETRKTRFRDAENFQQELEQLKAQLCENGKHLEDVKRENESNFAEKLIVAATYAAKVLLRFAPFFFRNDEGGSGARSVPAIEEISDSD